MNKLILCLLFSLVISSAFSQRVYFVYVQAEQEQPFYLTMNEKVYSSTASGYLILSRLKDTSYAVSIGFPQNKWPIQRFTIAIKSRDHGFLLKNFGDKGWGLFDLQSLAVQMAETDKIKTSDNGKIENKDVSSFTEVLAKAVDDPSLKEKPVRKEEKKTEVAIKKEEPKTEPIKDPPVIKTVDTNPVLVVKKEEPKTEVKQPPVTKTSNTDNQATKQDPPKTETTQTTKQAEVKEVPPTVGDPKVVVTKDQVKDAEIKSLPEETYKRSVVTKRSQSSIEEGLVVFYTDENANGKDTILIVIPNAPLVVNTKGEEVKKEKKFLDISSDTSAKSQEKVTAVKPNVVETTTKKATTNNCQAQADQTDFLKLRKQIAGIESEDDMVVEARKYFRKKCFTVAQIKNLSSLFLFEAGKYKFFDAAYSYVSDVENFASLQAELKEEYYVNRFKAMLR